MNLDAFEKELRKRVHERDPTADVHVMRTFTSAVTGEYIAVIETGHKTEKYAFNPKSGNWVVVYDV